MKPEELSVQSLRQRIKENLRRHELALTLDTGGPHDDGGPASRSGASPRERLIAFGLRHKGIIKRIPLLNKVATRVYCFLVRRPASRDSSLSVRTKGFIRKIPVLGFLAWWAFSVLKAPSRIAELAGEMAALRKQVRGFSAQLINESEDRVKLRQEVRDIGARLPLEIEIADRYSVKGTAEADPCLVTACGRNAGSAGHDIDEVMKDKVFYRVFEDLFRGTTTEIEKRQSFYMPYVLEANTRSKGDFFLDLGCGRGEYLALLRQQGIPAKGVDTHEFTVASLRKDSFDVTLSDGLDFLQALTDNTLKGLTLFQVVEHLSFEYMKSLLAAAFKKIAANGVIILESPNPYCPVALGRFYLDPTHIRPLPPDLMKLMLEWYGFADVEIIYSAPLPKSLRFAFIAMNYQDYAVIGRKPGE